VNSTVSSIIKARTTQHVPQSIASANHIAVMEYTAEEQLVVQRAAEAQAAACGKRIDLNINGSHNAGMPFGQAYVLQTHSVTGYGPTHITVGYFRNGISSHMKAQIESYVASLYNLCKTAPVL
jgi:flagellar capping protein FliD